MDDLRADSIGAAWLARAFAVEPIARMSVRSRVGGRRATVVQDGDRLETYPEAMRPAAEPAAHQQFHLRREVRYLKFLARVFARSEPGFVQAWVADRPRWPPGRVPLRVADRGHAAGAKCPGRQRRRRDRRHHTGRSRLVPIAE